MGADGRAFMMALMHVAGIRNCDIARRLNYTEAWVSTKLSSPLMQAQIQDLRGELRAATIDDAMALIEREVPASVQMLIEARDNGENYTVKRTSAESILDRHPAFAKRTKHEEEHTVRLVLSTADVRQMIAAHPMQESPQVIVVEADAEREAPSPLASTLRTLDESILHIEEALTE